MDNENKKQKTVLSPQSALSELQYLEAQMNEGTLGEDDVTVLNELKAELHDQFQNILKENPDLKKTPMGFAILRAAELTHKMYDKETNSIRNEDFFVAVSQPNLRTLIYSPDAVYNRLSEEQQRALDSLYLQLMNPEQFENFADEVKTPKEAAERLGLEERDVEKAFGLLSSIAEDRTEGDSISFVAIDFGKDTSGGERTSGSGNGAGGEGGELPDKYMGRVRCDADGETLSIVLDAVPPEYGNALYVLRGDDGRLADSSGALSSKVAARAYGARRIFHREETGDAGVLSRVHRALLMSFADFLDRSKKL